MRALLVEAHRAYWNISESLGTHPFATHIFAHVLILDQRRRRIFLLDRAAKANGKQMRSKLGIFLSKKLSKNVPENEIEAKRGVSDSGKTKPELFTMWEEQKKIQLSARACAFICV